MECAALYLTDVTAARKQLRRSEMIIDLCKTVKINPEGVSCSCVRIMSSLRDLVCHVKFSSTILTSLRD